jgi:hypothetical protein
MGWDYQNTTTDAASIIRDSLERSGRSVIECHKSGWAYYVAYRERDSNSVSAFVVLADRRGVMGLGLKWMHECEGPYYHDVPASFLDLLTTTDRGYANVWRQRCREKAAA